MSIYILPKNYNKILLQENQYQNQDLILYNLNLSQSIFKYYAEIIKEIPEEEQNKLHIFYSYSYIKQHFNKLIPKSIIFYDLYEIYYYLITLYSINTFIEPWNTLHIGKNAIDSYNCFSIIRDNLKDNHIYLEKWNTDTFLFNHKINYIFYEIDKNLLTDISTFHICLKIILQYQIYGGIFILKLNKLNCINTIDIIYILSTIYDKVYIIKPNTSNIITFEKYIVCYGYLDNWEKNTNININITINILNNHYTHIPLTRIITNQIPIYFTNKIDDINIILGMTQLEALDKIINPNIIKEKKEKKVLIPSSLNYLSHNKLSFNIITLTDIPINSYSKYPISYIKYKNKDNKDNKDKYIDKDNKEIYKYIDKYKDNKEIYKYIDKYKLNFYQNSTKWVRQ